MNQAELNQPVDSFGALLVAFLRANRIHLGGLEPPSSVTYSRNADLDCWVVAFRDSSYEPVSIHVDAEDVLGWMWLKLGNLLSPSGY
ncbi:hypothetical protein V0M98_32375 (plasmid) [Pseudomonas silesiensis]|uniref:hypothetical protein n=1 Tax=Pseudomonas silesiensis TaxID=1853130 RepID=UPI0030CB8B66